MTEVSATEESKMTEVSATKPLLPDPRDRPMVGFKLACRILDIGTTKGYELANGKDGKTFPVTVKKVGGVWKVPTLELHRLIGSELAGITTDASTKTVGRRSKATKSARVTSKAKTKTTKK